MAKEQKHPTDQERHKAYWQANIKLLSGLLVVWFAVSFGAGILFVDTLNKINFFGMPLGFWFAQQGSIYAFVILIFVYVYMIARVEERYGVKGE